MKNLSQYSLSSPQINDRHEFPFEIDLAEFLDPLSDARQESQVYHLHGVLVHSGDLNGGHYFALIKPEKDGRWFKYDDDRVVPVTDKEVLEDNYGGDMTNGLVPPNQRQQARTMKKFTNAYMLVYVRHSAIDDVLKPFGPEDTPPHLKARLDKEREEREAARREKDEQHLYLTAKIITDETFAKHQGFDMASFDEKNIPPSELPSFRVLKSEPFSRFKQRVSEHFGYPLNNFRLWVLVNRQNKTIRPDVFVQDSEANQTMDQIRSSMTARSNDLRLYLDYQADPSKWTLGTSGYGDAATGGSPTIMIFLKWFDVQHQTLLGQGTVFVGKNQKISDLCPIICERMGWAPTTPLKLYEEIKAGMIELMKPRQNFVQSEIQDGDVICFQVEMTEKEVQDYEAQQLYAQVPQFYDFLQNRVLVNFKPKFEEPSELNPEFDLMLSKKMTYDVMAQRVGEHLKHDPLRLRFTSSNANNLGPKAVIKRALNQSVGDLTQTGYYGNHPVNVVLYYERLDVSIVELETKKSLKITWTGSHNKEESTHPFLLPKTSTFSDVAEALSKLVTLSPNGSRKVRIFEISPNGRQQKECTSSEMIANLREPVELFAEEVPLDELNVTDDDKVIDVFHYHRDPSRYFGVPFRFVVKNGERFENTKLRLQERLAVSDKDLARFRFALIQSHHYKQPSNLNDGEPFIHSWPHCVFSCLFISLFFDLPTDDVLFDHKFMGQDALGLDHIDKGPRKPNPTERAIVIR